MLRSIRRFCLFAAFILAAVSSALCQGVSGDHALPPAAPAVALNSTSPARVAIGAVYLGSYAADGRFRRESQTAYTLRMSNSPQRAMLNPLPGAASNERVIADYEPPAHAAKPLKGHSALVNFRDALITFAYGHQPIFQAPTHVITDSRGRVIVSDPSLASVHVLDATGRSSFRIEGAPGRRLHSPTGIAVDAEDNIYIADGRRGFILVYDPEGRFLRYIGNFHGESLFQAPVALAIDCSAGRLYVVDNLANELVMLDLRGRILKRVGGDRDRTGKVKFNLPSEIALRDHKLAILDGAGTRIQLLDSDCNWTNGFDIQALNGPPAFHDMGLAIDSSSHIYVSNLMGSAIRVYKSDGHLVATLGHHGSDMEGFNAPAGAWIDSEDRIYIADTHNNRVQVFQVVGASEGTGVDKVATGTN